MSQSQKFQAYYENRQGKSDISFRDDREGRMPLHCKMHLHHELELVYLLEGETLAYADTVQATLHPGDVFITFPNQIHYYDTLKKEKYLLFIIKPELIPEFLDLFTMGAPTSPVIIKAGEIPRVHDLFLRLFEACRDRQHPYADSRKRGYLLVLFSELLPHLSVEQLTMNDSGALRSIVSYCTRNFSEDLSLSVLEEKLHLNKYYISHLFSNRLGIRFNDYINSLRISEACRYLLNTDYSVTEISELVGFNTLRTFNRAFTKQIGASPTEYRKNENLPARSGTSTKVFVPEEVHAAPRFSTSPPVYSYDRINDCMDDCMDNYMDDCMDDCGCN